MHFPRFSAENSAKLCILGGKARREDAEKCRERDLRSHRRSDAQRRDAHFIVHRRSCGTNRRLECRPGRQMRYVAGVPGDCESCGEPTALGAACTPPSAPRRSRRGAPRRWTAQGLGRTCGGQTRWRVPPRVSLRVQTACAQGDASRCQVEPDRRPGFSAAPSG